MAIVKLTPSCKDYLWGGSRLRTDFGVQSSLDPLAEAWVLSCHPDGPSYLPDGSTLADYVAAHPGCLGTDCEKFEQFPILTKFIDAKNNLSIQVHPSNEYALKNEHQYGKTEMWYVLDCEPGAFLYYGFDHEVSKEEFDTQIKQMSSYFGYKEKDMLKAIRQNGAIGEIHADLLTGKVLDHIVATAEIKEV